YRDVPRAHCWCPRLYCSAEKEERMSGHAFPISTQSKVPRPLCRTGARASKAVISSSQLDESTVVLQDSCITIGKSKRVRIRNDTRAIGLEYCFRNVRPTRSELIQVM